MSDLTKLLGELSPEQQALLRVLVDVYAHRMRDACRFSGNNSVPRAPWPHSFARPPLAALGMRAGRADSR